MDCHKYDMDRKGYYGTLHPVAQYGQVLKQFKFQSNDKDDAWIDIDTQRLIEPHTSNYGSPKVNLIAET